MNEKTIITYKSKFNKIYRLYKENNNEGGFEGSEMEITGKNCILHIKRGDVEFLLNYDIVRKFYPENDETDFTINYCRTNDPYTRSEEGPIAESKVMKMLNSIMDSDGPRIVSFIEKFYDLEFFDMEYIDEAMEQGDTSIEFDENFSSFVVEECMEEYLKSQKPSRLISQGIPSSLGVLPGFLPHF